MNGPTYLPADVAVGADNGAECSLLIDDSPGGPIPGVNATGQIIQSGDRVLVLFSEPQGVWAAHLLSSRGNLAEPQGIMAPGTGTSNPATRTSDVGSIAGSYVDLTGLTVTVTPITASRNIAIRAIMHFSSGTAGDEALVALREGATVLDTQRVTHVAGSVWTPMHFEWTITAPTAGVHTYKMSALLNAGTGPFTMKADATTPAWMKAVDEGRAL